MSADNLERLKGRGPYGTFLHDITVFYHKYHTCVSFTGTIAAEVPRTIERQHRCGVES